MQWWQILRTNTAIKEHELERNHLVILLTQILADQFLEDLRNAGVCLVDSITTETNKGRVKAEISKYFTGTMDTGHVLVVLWPRFDDLPYFENKGNWDILKQLRC